MHKYFPLITILILLFALCSCASVKPYQRVYLNDPQMQVGVKSSAQFEDYYQSIREGSTSASFGKSAEGCGCK